MPDRDHWFHKKAPYARRARRRLKPKPGVLNEDLLKLPLGENREVLPDPEELSEEAKGFLHRLFHRGKNP